MRKLLFILTLMLLPFMASAQTMNVHMKDGGVRRFDISEIDYVDFAEKEDDSENNPILVNYHRIYDQAFIARFGQISPNQDWGFGKFRTRGENENGIRIIAEDVYSQDFDFNDVVFDVEWTQEGTKIRLQAVGSTYPVVIGDKEVHEMFGVNIDEMVNVGTGLSKAPVSFTLPSMYNYNPNEIPIRALYRGGTWVELEAVIGAPASKIAVGTDYKWCDEGQAIDYKYPDFVSWVEGSMQEFYATEQNNPSVPVEENIYIDENRLRLAWSAIYSQVHQMNACGKDVEARYTGIVNDEAFKAPLSPSNQMLNSLWDALYTSINRNKVLGSNVEGEYRESSKAMCDILDALAYEELTTYFGDVPYVSENDDIVPSIPRTSVSTIVDNLITRLSQTRVGAKDRQGVVLSGLSNLEELSSPSIDLVNLVFAELYISKGDYQTAKGYLLSIINSGHYFFQSTTRQGLDVNEALFSLRGSDSEVSIIRTYSDVLLLIAECESRLGNVSASQSYITQVTRAKGLETDLTDLSMAIAQVRRALQGQTNGYFAYLKRSGLAQELLGLEAYQLLLPIPNGEMIANPMIIQNPGY